MDWHTFYSAVYFTVFHLTKAVLAPLQRDSFIYWPFLLSSVLISIIAWMYWRNGDAAGSWSSYRARFFSARLWWHRSARADYRFYFANAVLYPATVGILLLTPDQLSGRLDALLSYGAQSTGQASLPWMIAFTALFFLAYDFGRFLAHSALHDISILWEFHKVHHSAEVLTPMTNYRAHPVDLFVMAWGSTLTTGLATWSFNHLAGGRISFMMFLDLHVLIWISSLIGNLRHSPVWITYGPTWSKWLISPAHHQLHHSREARHLGCNRGFDLALWDRMFGTLYIPTHLDEKFSMGLDDVADWHSVRHMFVAPFKAALRLMMPRRRREPASPVGE